VGDQLISLSPSEFAIAATVLELDEPAPFVVIIVNHGILHEGGAAFVVADEVPTNLFDATCA
jgi:hypothetical protein